MSEVNLLPRARQDRLAQRRLLRGWGVATLAWLALLVAVHLVVSGARPTPDDRASRRELEELRSEETRLVDELARLERSSEQDRRSLAAARATVDHPDWSILLSRVVTERDASIVFRRWALERGESHRLALRLEGRVPRLATLTDFVLRLERFGVFQRVTLSSAKAAPSAEAAASGEAAIDFAIEAELVAAIPSEGGKP